MELEHGRAEDAFALLTESIIAEMAKWRIKLTIDKYIGEWTPEQIERGEAAQALIETFEQEGNLLMYGGVSCLWECLMGNGTGTAGQALTFFNNGNAAIGVGDSSTTEAATQTDLQAATNKLRKAMDSTYPQHSDGTSSGAATITFKSTFGTGDANWVWNEWGIFNSATAATGRMLNRKVVSMGTKTSAATWVVTATVTIS